MAYRPLPQAVRDLMQAGFTQAHAMTLRRLSMRLRRWYEMECGNSEGAIERREGDGVPMFRSAMGDNRAREIHDDEASAKKSIDKIMEAYPDKQVYIQSDPRGCALYILRPGDVPEGSKPDECYSRGVAVYQ